MRNKPVGQWHNFEFFAEEPLGEQEIAVSFNAETLKTFFHYAQKRLRNGTGLRFKFTAKAMKQIIRKKGRLYRSIQFYSQAGEGYIFPEQSKHTNRYDSHYNRVELYLPIELMFSKEECDNLETLYLNADFDHKTVGYAVPEALPKKKRE